LENFALSINSTIDFLAIGALLDNLIEAAAICGQTQDVAMWLDMKTKMPQFSVGDTGCLREYTNSAFTDRNNNLGSMHGYGLWPLKNLSFKNQTVMYQPAVAVGATGQKQPIDLRKASFNAIMARLSASWKEQDARSILTCVNQVAHSGIPNEAGEAAKSMFLRILSSVISQSGLCQSCDWRGSGFTKNAESDFDMVGNVGLMNAITECVVQSNSKTLRILPCVFDAIGAGRITDVATDFAAAVSIDWDLKKGKCVVKIVPRVTGKINIEVNKTFRKIKSKDFAFAPDINGIKDFPLVANRAVTIEFM
jgi:hypothetical protein